VKLSQCLGKRVKHTRKPPNNHIIANGVLERTKHGIYEIARDDGGYSAIFNGDTLECNGKSFIVKQ